MTSSGKSLLKTGLLQLYIMRTVLLLLTLVFLTCADAQPMQKFKQDLDSIKERLHIPGLSVAVIQNGHAIWSAGTGYADMENRVKATAATAYPIASLTKPIAATLFLQLLEQQKISLDDPIKKYFPRDFSTENVRVKHLLTHTAAAGPGGKPGDRYAYSGSWYGYVAYAIAGASGQSFRDRLVYEVLSPLHMNSSVPGHDVLHLADSLAGIYGKTTVKRYVKQLSKMAKPYTLYGKNNVLSPYPPDFIGSSAGLTSTVEDLAKFDHAIDNHLLIKKETQELAWTNFLNNSSQPIPYGLGWFVQQIEGVKVIWHYGQWPVFTGLYIKVPEKNIRLIILTNSTSMNAPFDLDKGDLLVSPVAIRFLQDFVLPGHDFSIQEKAAAAAAETYLEKRSKAVQPQ